MKKKKKIVPESARHRYPAGRSYNHIYIETRYAHLKLKYVHFVFRTNCAIPKVIHCEYAHTDHYTDTRSSTLITAHKHANTNIYKL